jgi:hypothetical protein
MPVRGKFEIKGLDAYLEDMVSAGIDIDEVVSDVLTEAAPVAKAELKKSLLKTKQAGEVWTGVTEDSIAASSVQRDGNYHFIELSVSGEGVQPKEYGNTRQAAEPFIRPAFRQLRQSKLKVMMKAVMERFGLPTS